ncbi:MAG: acyltransferase [Bacteroidetes bacterium]|nr:acyltransferase [Bacteroidota bacterium]
MNQINSTHRLDNLDIVRFILAYTIMFFHAFYGWKENFGYPSFVMNEAGTNLSHLGGYIENVIHNFSLGGEAFFLISGFMIMLLLLGEQDSKGDIHIRSFYIKRSLRVLPLYFIVLATGPIFTWLMDAKVPNYSAWIFLLGNIDLAHNGWSAVSVNHLWSVDIEMQFYFIIPLVLVFIRRKHLPLFFTFIIFLSFIYRIFAFHSQNPWQLIYLHSLSRMDTLAIGCWVGLIYHERKNFIFINTLPVRMMFYFILFYILCVDQFTDYSNLFYATAKKYFYLLACCYFLANYLFNPIAKLVPKKRNFLHYLGLVTFGIYMFNNMVIAVMITICKHYPAVKNFWVYFIIINIITIPLAILSYHFLELPISNLKRYIVKTNVELKKA